MGPSVRSPEVSPAPLVVAAWPVAVRMQASDIAMAHTTLRDLCGKKSAWSSEFDWKRKML
jgi:hypothetical protein